MGFIDRKELYWNDNGVEKPVVNDGEVPMNFKNATRMMPSEIQAHRYEDEIVHNGTTIASNTWNMSGTWIDVSEFNQIVALSKGESGQTNQLQLVWSTDQASIDYANLAVASDNGQYGKIVSPVLAKWLKIQVKNNNTTAAQVITTKLTKMA